jgi:hypothetical protein
VEAGRDAVCWQGTHNLNAVEVITGSVSIAMLGGESATVATLSIGYHGNQATDATVNVGTTASLTRVQKSGGTLTVWGNGLTTLIHTGGTTYIVDGTLSTLNIWGGTVYFQGTGTITNIMVGALGVLRFSADLRARTVTNCTLVAGGKISDPLTTVSWTNAIVPGTAAPPAFPDF